MLTKKQKKLPMALLKSYYEKTKRKKKRKREIMPYHTGHGKKEKIKKVKNLKWVQKEKIMVKVASITNIIKGLKPRQQKTMKAHARHHSLKHMRSMARALKKVLLFKLLIIEP